MSLRKRAPKDEPRLIRVAKGQKRRAASRKMKVHTRPQVKAVRIKGQTKCDVCWV